MLYRHFILILALVWAASCSENFGADTPGAPETGKVEVAIGGVQGATRTSLEGDGRTTRWSVGDKVALWATADQGTNYVLSAQAFTLRTYNSLYSTADFSSMLSEPMAEGTYTYYAVYPQPAEVSGTTVTYTLPAVQPGGGYNGTYDIMVAAPATGAQLDKYAHDELQLCFRHLLHMIRIEIPAGRNHLGSGVRRLEIEFPAQVTGSISFDVTRPEETMTFSGSNKLTLDFDGEGLTDTEGLYAYAFVPAGEMNGELSFRAYDQEGVMSRTISTSISKTMAPGRVTPIALTIPERRPITRLDFQVAENNLGEAPTNIRLTAPEGLRFIKPFDPEGSAEAVATPDASGIFRTMVYAEDSPGATIAGKSLAIDYESENAVLSNCTVTLPETITDNTNVNVPMSVPYLMFEDFSNLTETGTQETSEKDMSNDGLPGWVAGQRSTYFAGKCVGLRSYSNIGGPFHSRMNSCPLGNIKDGKTITIRLIYNSDWKKNKSSSMNVNVGRSTGTGHDDGIDGGRSVAMTNNGSASENNIPTQHEVTITGCMNANRISWKTSGQNGTWFNYDNVYIDNVRVQIVK